MRFQRRRNTTNLRDLRKSRRMQQSEIARALNVSQSAVSCWEAGKTGVCRKHRTRLCELFGCTEEELSAALVETRKERA